MGDKSTDAKEMIEIFEFVSSRIPELLNSLTDVLYGQEQAGKYGTAIAGFYKAMKESGMTEEQAYELTQQYMSSLNLPGLISQAISSRGEGVMGKKKIDIDLEELKRAKAAEEEEERE